jgi:HSP20 family molecular chaperone IbpA
MIKKTKAKSVNSDETKVNSAQWKEMRQKQYRRRLAVPSGMKPEDVSFQKKAMDEVDKLPVSEGGKGK